MLKINYKFHTSDLDGFNNFLKHYEPKINQLHIVDRFNIRVLTLEIDKLIFYSYHKKKISKSINLNTLKSLNNFYDLCEFNGLNVFSICPFAQLTFYYIFELYFKHIKCLENEFSSLFSHNNTARLQKGAIGQKPKSDGYSQKYIDS